MRKYLLPLLILSMPLAAQDTRLAELAAQVERLQAEIRTMSGALQTQNIQNRQMESNVERSYRDLEMHMAALESRMTQFQEVLKRALKKVAPALAQETEAFEKGLNLVTQKKYAEALSAFQQFAKKYPLSPQKSDALFWIGECRYSLKDYTLAIKDFQKFVDATPKSPKVPEALLRQGDGFANLQMNDEAKVFWQKIVQEYPNSKEASLAKTKLNPPAVSPVPNGLPTPPPLPPANPQIQQQTEPKPGPTADD